MKRILCFSEPTSPSLSADGIIRNMDKAPQWDLSTIYPSPSSPEFLDDIARLDAIGRVLTEDAVSMAASDLIALRDSALAISINLTAYASALLSTDSSNPEYLKALSSAEKAEAGFSKAEDAFIRAFPDDGPVPDGYGYIASEIRMEKQHLMSREEEALAADLAISGTSLWEHLQELLASSIGDGLMLPSLRALAMSGDREERKRAFMRELALLRTHAPSFAYALSGVKGTVLTLDGKRGWKSPLERSLFQSRISESTFNALIGSIEDALPIFHEYFRIKAGLLGLKDFSFYDLFAPVGSARRSYSFNEAVDIVVSSFREFSDEAGNFAEMAIGSGWVDAAMHEGKAGGAYDTYFPLRRESRVFMNFDGSYDSVLTLSHELGHAYHDHVLSSLPVSLASYPMTLAETASTFSEKLVFQHIISGEEGTEGSLFAIDQFLASVAQTVVDIYSRYLFEKSAFERAGEGPLSADDCASMMLEAQQRAYGSSLSELHPYMWAVKSHYYSADFSYYNYPYAFGELFALSLFMKRGEAGFQDMYRKLLMNTGSMSAEDAAMSIGMDISESGFWKAGIGFIGSYIERLGRWL